MMRERWMFFLEAKATGVREWHWRVVDADSGAIERTSEIGFRSLYDCIKDAERNGYMGFREPQRICHTVQLPREHEHDTS